jgi:hypothetical protein
MGGRGGRIVVIGQPQAKARPYLKNKLKANRGEGIAQVAEYLPLSSNANSTKKKKKKTLKTTFSFSIELDSWYTDVQFFS